MQSFSICGATIKTIVVQTKGEAASYQVVGRPSAEDAKEEGEHCGAEEADAAAARIPENAPGVRARHGPAEHNAGDQALLRGRYAPLAPHLQIRRSKSSQDPLSASYLPIKNIHEHPELLFEYSRFKSFIQAYEATESFCGCFC